MENKIKETTEKLKNGTITKDEADKNLLDLFGVIKSVCEHEYMKRGGPSVYFLRCIKCGKIKM